VRQDVAIERIQSGIVDVRDEHALAQIIQDDDPRCATQSTECFLMELGPDARTGTEGQKAMESPPCSKLAFAKLRPKPCPQSISSPASSPTNSLVVASGCRAQGSDERVRATLVHYVQGHWQECRAASLSFAFTEAFQRGFRGTGGAE